MTDRLSPQREAETAERLAEIQSLDLLALMPEQSAAIVSGHLAALLAELAAVRAERDEAREAALNEAADWFIRLADFEPTQGYRAQVMRGAANDIRRLIATPAEGAGR
jgi:hypothetical protein